MEVSEAWVGDFDPKTISANGGAASEGIRDFTYDAESRESGLWEMEYVQF